MSGLGLLKLGWNILHQLLLSSEANSKWIHYIPQHCHPTTIYVRSLFSK